MGSYFNIGDCAIQIRKSTSKNNEKEIIIPNRSLGLIYVGLMTDWG